MVPRRSPQSQAILPTHDETSLVVGSHRLESSPIQGTESEAQDEAMISEGEVISTTR